MIFITSFYAIVKNNLSSLDTWLNEQRHSPAKMNDAGQQAPTGRDVQDITGYVIREESEVLKCTSIITLENKVGKFCILLLGIYPGEILANVCNKVHSSNA